jgi:hypothetical protein
MSELHKDAMRSAIAVARLAKNGDLNGMADLLATLDLAESHLVISSLSMIAATALAVMDDQARQIGNPTRSAQILRDMMMSAGDA